MEGEEREAAVIDEVVSRMSWVGRTSMSCMKLKVRKSPGLCLLVCKLTLFACSQGGFRHNLNNIDTTEPMSLCQT
jgi:hypothetical protein